jgi:hypothetical protein
MIARHGQSESSIVRIGLCDLLIAHEAGPQGLDYLADALVNLHDLDAYRYLVIALLTARRPALTALVSQAARLETRANRIAALAEALSIFSADPEIASLGAELRKRR